MNKINFLVASLLLLATTIVQAAEVVGRVGYMSGSLMAQCADGVVKVMGIKSEVLAGDILSTAKDSYAQILMNDGAKMTLRPNSNLKITEYKFNKEEPQSDNAVFSLLKGGLRAVTGLIGKRGNADAYKMQTTVATIGIRGTDYSSRLCATANCRDDDVPAKQAGKPANPPHEAGGAPLPAAPAAEAPPGLYVTVHDGQVIVAQPGRVLNLGRGDTGFATPAALIMLPAPPAFMKVDTKQIDAIDAKTSKSGGGGAAVNGPEGGLDSINNSNSPNPAVNKGGCVVQ